MYTINSVPDADDELVYVMSRPGGGGTIIGGQYSPHDWNGEVDLNLGQRIQQRVLELVPELIQGDNPRHLEIIQQNVGFRPTRDGGIRVEYEEIPSVGKVVHNYGHGGAGYQASYGTATAATDLVRTALHSARNTRRQSKL